MASLSRLASGRQSNRLMRRSRIIKASRKARSISSGVPVTTARIGNAPMRRHRLARPDGTHLLGRVVADREHEIHLGRSGFCELIPVLAAQALRRKMSEFDLLERLGPNPPGGVAARTVGGERRLALAVEDRLGHDRTRRIAGAQEEHVVASVRGHYFLAAASGAQHSGPQHDRSATLFSGRLSSRTANTSHSLPSGSFTQALSCSA